MPWVLRITKSTKLQISLCSLRQWANPKCYRAYTLQGAENRTVKQRITTRSSEPGSNSLVTMLSSLPLADFSQQPVGRARGGVAWLYSRERTLSEEWWEAKAAGLLTLCRHCDNRFGGGMIVIVFQRAITTVISLDVILINQFLEWRSFG